MMLNMNNVENVLQAYIFSPLSMWIILISVFILVVLISLLIIYHWYAYIGRTSGVVRASIIYITGHIVLFLSAVSSIIIFSI